MQGIAKKTTAAITGVGVGYVSVASNANFFKNAEVWLSLGSTKQKAYVVQLVGTTQIKVRFAKDYPNYELANTTSFNPAGNIQAELDMATLGAGNCDTVVEAVTAGDNGNLITVQLVGDSVAGVVINEVGNAVTIHYESGVSTVGDVETEIGLSATLIAVKTPGTGATILTAPGDNGGPANLTGGSTARISQALQLVPVTT